MNKSDQILYEQRARLIKAMAHPTRLFIIDELSHGPRCVCQLTKSIGADTSTVSKHLSVLKSAGIVSDSKDGLKVFYSLKVPCIMNFFKCTDHIIESNAKEQLSCVR